MKFKETNQICSPLKISQSINAEHSTCDRKNKGMYSCFDESKKFLNAERGKKQMMKTYFFKALANRFWLTSKSCSWFNKAVHGRPSFKWTPWEGNDMLLKVDKIYSLLRKFPWKWSLVNR